MNKQLSAQFDAIRGYSALTVLIAHLCAWFVLPVTGRNDQYGVLSALSFYAVLVFFVLSGYLITNSLWLNWKRNGAIDVPAFLSARAFRILPPFIFAMFLSLAVAGIITVCHLHGHDTFRLPGDLFLVRDNVQLNARDVIYSFLLSNGIVPGTNAIVTNGALWSLSIEVWLYFIALLLALAWEGRFRSKTALASLIGLAGVLLALSSSSLMFEFAVYWFLGAAFRLHDEVKAGKGMRRLLFALVALPGLLICLKTPDMLDPARQGIFSVPVNLSVLIILIGFLGLFPGQFTRWQQPGRFLAHSSYTLYIIHFPILALFFSIFHQSFAHWGQTERILFLSCVAVLILAISHFAALILEDRNLWRNLSRSIAAKLSPSSREKVGKPI